MQLEIVLKSISVCIHFISYFGQRATITGLRGKWCGRGSSHMSGCVILYFWNMDTLSKGAFKTDTWMVLWGDKKTSLFLWGANCSTTSILFIAVWMFLLTAHLCTDWAVKILSSCSEWTGSHIQGHYALGVRKIKHQIKADLGPFNCLSQTQRSQPGFFSLEMEQFPGTSTVMHYNVWISTVISALIRKTSMATV